MRIAVVGSGISGNAAAWALSRGHDVTLYERRERPGGHSATVDVDYDGRKIAVDTGFIVYNEHNYPLLTRLFDQLGVETELSEMSFSVSLDGGRLEWCGRTLKTVFAQRRNLLSPGFLLMLRDIFRFNARAKRDLGAGMLCGLTFGDYIEKRGFSARLRDDYILPLCAAIWSTPTARMLDFPAESLIRFLDNHRLIHLQRPWWRTVRGGSRGYVERLLADFDGEVLLGTPVDRVERANGLVYITDRKGNRREYDAVVLAAHSDQSLRMLADPTAEERSILESVEYRPNKVWLHRDPELMPKRRDAWAAWNYLGSRAAGEDGKGAGERDITVTYWMNKLQNIDYNCPLFITLNPARPPRPELTFGLYEYSHPQFDAGAIDAQQRLSAIQGANNTWYCGAWTRYGFHEDGLASGLEVAERMGVSPPWAGEERKIVHKYAPILFETAPQP
jgi:predicted NAD/FAD-binding protein